MVRYKSVMKWKQGGSCERKKRSKSKNKFQRYILISQVNPFEYVSITYKLFVRPSDLASSYICMPPWHTPTYTTKTTMNSSSAFVRLKYHHIKRLTVACVVAALWTIIFLQRHTDLTRLLGLPLGESRPNSTKQDGPSFTVDILSIASINQLHLLNAQHKTLALHVSV
jgi:hypothetical protein